MAKVLVQWPSVWFRTYANDPFYLLTLCSPAQAQNWVKKRAKPTFGQINDSLWFSMSRKDPNKPRGRTTAYAFFVIAEKEAFYRVSFMTPESAWVNKSTAFNFVAKCWDQPIFRIIPRRNSIFPTFRDSAVKNGRQWMKMIAKSLRFRLMR